MRARHQTIGGPDFGGEAGMTLVEMLVVLAIIGISAGAVVLSLGGSHRSDGQREALRLVARLQLAADDAMASDHALALSLTPTSYAIVERSGARQDWQAAGSQSAHLLPRGMTLSSDAPTAIVPLDADGAGRPFSVTLNAGNQHWRVAFDGMKARLDQQAALLGGGPA